MRRMIGMIMVVLAGVLTVAVITAMATRGRTVSAKRWNRGVKPWIDALFQAATAGDLNRLRYLVQTQGCSPSLQDADGYTALHLAYYWERQDAVEALIGFGADRSLRAATGLLPAEMAELALTERLLRMGIACLGGLGHWRDQMGGRFSYDRLRQVNEPRIYIAALPLVWAALGHSDRRTLVLLAIKLGVPASLPWLARILRDHGTKQMAADFRDSGSIELRALGTRWLRGRSAVVVNGIPVYVPLTPGRRASPPALWGCF
ncbi:MAG TPA: ankyrin repeat domain-containing protein [Pseudonocardiaceae bacterium]|nr:ankyrin repeat domain-containing protein [Pseudonocardiaceae bacterium]